MTIRTKRIQQVMIGILAVLSLSFSSIAACACTHHRQQEQPKTSCHSATTSSHHDQPKADTTGPAINESCFCIQLATKLSVKVEGFKLKKIPAASLFNSATTSTSYSASVPALASQSPFTFYERQLYIATASRGPPVS